jgi:DNA-binding transcriptional MerR regulator
MIDVRRWTLAQVAERTGAKRRAIQLWADGGVIRSTPETDRGGTGVHRLFERQEVQIAALLVPLAEMGMPIGELRSFGNCFRAAFHYIPIGAGGPSELRDLMESRGPEIKRAFDRAASGIGRNYILLAHGDLHLWVHTATDETGSVSIDPAEDFAGFNLPKNAAIIILDLTKLLGSLLA